MGIRAKLSHAANEILGVVGYQMINKNNKNLKTSAIIYNGNTYEYENIIILDSYAPWSNDKQFKDVWDRILDKKLVDVLRCYELYDLVREVSYMSGDILEVGVWRGATGAVLSAAAKMWMPTSRVWLCDTFEGVVKAGTRDSTYVGGEHADTSVGTVLDLLASLGLDNATILKGIFPDETGAQLSSVDIALCHIDVDVYQSARDIVDWILPRMKPGSILVFDDYGFSTCTGITALVAELRLSGEWTYIYNINKHAVLIRRDHTMRSIVVDRVG